MFTALFIITIIFFVLLVVVASVHPAPSVMSGFELNRRAKQNKIAKFALRREYYLSDILTLQRVLVTLLLVITVLLSVATFNWFFGVLIAVIITLEYAVVARFQPLSKFTHNLYLKIEPKLLDFVEWAQPAFRFVRGLPMHDVDAYHRFDSREELQRMIERSGEILSKEERQLIVHAFEFKDKTVESIMTPKSIIDSIKASEFLGPLVLSELHKLGHSRLPVIKEDIDHIIGVLHLKNLLSLNDRQSTTAEQAMEKKVFYIRHDDTLEHALAAFIKARHHLFIVINEYRETVGLLTLEDVMEALLGRKIVDEDDNHEDLRAVAAKNVREFNSPEGAVDV